jgi:hypothetical protein
MVSLYALAKYGKRSSMDFLPSLPNLYAWLTCIIYNFALFRFQLDTPIILYIYNLGFLSIFTCFGPIDRKHVEINKKTKLQI